MTSFSDYINGKGLAADPAFATARAEALLGLPMAALRESTGLTQAHVANCLGKTQAAVSKFECRNDFLLSSLFEYVEALGGSVDIQISTAQKRFNLNQNRDEDIRYFRLEEKKASKPCSILKFANAFEEKRRPMKPQHSAWADYKSSMGDASTIESSLAEQFKKAANDEDQSAAA